MTDRSHVKRFFSELRRRKVLRVAAVYAGLAWILLQVAEVTFAPLQLPEWALTLVLMLAILGFPVAVVLAWVLERTPGGIRRDSSPDETRPPADEKTGPAPAERSIAVLPFVDMSPDHDQDYFCEGMAEEILNALTRVDGLRVAARTSAFQFKGRAVDLRKVGQDLGVSTVLEGSVRKSGDQLRLTAQLINVADGYHLWSERYDRRLADVFAIQDEIATEITRALQIRLTPRDRTAIRTRTTDDMEAYDHYLRGRQFMNQFGPRSMVSARMMFERAIELDPDYAPAYAGLSLANAMIHMYWDPDPKFCQKAQLASARAIELDPESAEVHAAHGLAELLANRFGSAEHAFERAIELDPRSFDAYYYYARNCASSGQLDKAVQLYEKAATARPEDYQAILLSTQVYRALGRHDDARSAAERGLRRAERALELNPNDVRALYLSGNALGQLGRDEEARNCVERALMLEPDEPSVLYNAACFYSQSGDLDRAMELLERAVLPGMANRVWVEHDSDLDPLRDLPRFKAYLETLR